MPQTEKQYYELLKASMEEAFLTKVDSVHFEITANRQFTNQLKSEIPSNRDIIFCFLQTSAPDITGFVRREVGVDFIVVELKTQPLRLQDIYQTRRYADLFQSKFAFLVSLQPIREEIKRLHEVVDELLNFPTIYREFTLLQFEPEDEKLLGWYPRNPFKTDWFWD
ncbi:MAG: hypothetical protein R6U57_12985 [Anaerolineales bacterium]